MNSFSPVTLGRAKRLKLATASIHDRLDARIMALDPFSSRTRYGMFLKAQYRFHHQLAPIYAAPSIAALVPDIGERERLTAALRDLEDLHLVPPESDASPAPAPDDLPAALGWLYVAEGSSLGAAFLLKAAERIGLGTTFGARHLAAHAGGRGASWRRFTAVVDGLAFDVSQDHAMIDAARNAFTRFRRLADATFV